MDYAYCWHRPGKLHRIVRLCRYCRVAIEACVCGDDGRSAKSDCRACEGSGWVGIVRSKAAGLTAVLADRVRAVLPTERYRAALAKACEGRQGRQPGDGE